MAKNTDFSLKSFDDIFSSQEQRDNDKISKIRDIPINLIDDFPNHPFKVRDDEDMQRLVESVKENGVITPATVMEKKDGRYTLISGHRRKRASELAGYSTLRCDIVEMTDEEAIVRMVESNYQRTQLLPSELAFAYKMRLDAIKRQGKRTDLVEDENGGKESVQVISEQSGDSQSQIRRYIRLTELIPELLELVDTGSLKMRPAIDISYFSQDIQKLILKEINDTGVTPSMAQAEKMHRFADTNKLTAEVISSIMCEESTSKNKFVLKSERIKSFIPKSIPKNETEDYVCKALEYYNTHNGK